MDETAVQVADPQSAQAAGVAGGIRLRVKVLGGVLSGEQWRAVGRLAGEFAPATPLHLTTRQDIELHDVAAESAGQVQARLAEVDLVAKPSCGNSVRNITVCPCSGVRTGAADLGPLAWRVRRTLEAIEPELALPRKFKISLSACAEGCGQPWINDLGLVAAHRDGRWSFRAVVAGSLGVRPALGVVFRERLDPDDVLPLAVAALRVFAAHGDRENRRTARLRHVRERMGDAPFAALMETAFAQAKAERAWPPAELPAPARGFDATAALTFPSGNLDAASAEAVGALADRPDLRVRIDTHQRLIVSAGDEATLAEALAGLPAPLRQAARPQPAVVTCPGRQWCKNAVTDTATMAELVRRDLGDRLPAGMVVGVCGCPNGCAHTAVAPIGLIGAKVGGRDVYTVYAGGGLGRDNRMARQVAAKLPPEAAVEQIAELVREQGARG